jgi:ubiquinone/menaquinone biosynthesis C-methylase UbiE
MIEALLAVGMLLGGWLVVRRVGRGKPFPASLAGLIDNPVTRAFSGTSTLIQRAGVGAGMRVLDAGSGPGRLTIPLARQVGPAGEVVALDVQEGMLERVRRRARIAGLANVRTILAPLAPGASLLAAERAAYDRALLVTVLGEVPDRAAALALLHSMLKPGGILSITEIILDPDYQRRATVQRLAEGAGFRLDRSFGSAVAFTSNFRKRPEDLRHRTIHPGA